MRGESLSGPTPRRIGIRDVAQRAGVAISTVSKVFSGRGEVMPALRLRVLSAASELGWRAETSFGDGVRRYVDWLAVTNGSPVADAESRIDGSAATVLLQESAEL